MSVTLDTLPSWLTATLGGQDARGQWSLDWNAVIVQDGIGRNAVFTAVQYASDHGADWERELPTADAVVEFVTNWQNTDEAVNR